MSRQQIDGEKVSIAWNAETAIVRHC